MFGQREAVTAEHKRKGGGGGGGDGEGDVGVGGADFRIGGSVEMKEVLQYISHLLEQCFSPPP